MNYKERNKQAHEFFKAGEIDKAIELYEINIQLHEDCGASLSRLYGIYRKRIDKENTKRILKLMLVLDEAELKIAETAPKDKLYLINLENCKSIVDFTQSCILKAEDGRLFLNEPTEMLKYKERNKQAHELFTAGEFDKAIELYEINVQLMDDKEAIYNRLQTIYRNKGDKENQKRILKLLLVIHEKNLKTVENAPQVKGEQGKRHMFNVEKQRLVVDFVRTSIAQLDSVIAQDIKKKEDISAPNPLFVSMTNDERNKNAQEFYLMGDIDKAIELYMLNIELRTDTGASYISLSRIYNELEDNVNRNRILKLFVELLEGQLKTLEQGPKDKANLLKIKQQKGGIEYARNMISED
jgi:tetratricopeptide (TPR) repeat protein